VVADRSGSSIKVPCGILIFSLFTVRIFFTFVAEVPAFFAVVSAEISGFNFGSVEPKLIKSVLSLLLPKFRLFERWWLRIVRHWVQLNPIVFLKFKILNIPDVGNILYTEGIVPTT
jgi:hypothetical protein